LDEKPQCDISYDEISRWLSGVTASKLPLRGMAARSLSIELYLGVTCPFAIGRVETARPETNVVASRRDEQTQALAESQRGRAVPNSPQVAFLARSLDAITKRVDNLEKYVSADLELKRKIAAENSQQDLLSPLGSKEDPTKPAKKR
jgi:hypothetical protein